MNKEAFLVEEIFAPRLTHFVSGVAHVLGLTPALVLSRMYTLHASLNESRKLLKKDGSWGWMYYQKERLVEECFVSAKGVQQALGLLEDLGCFEVIRQGVPPLKFYKINHRRIQSIHMYCTLVERLRGGPELDLRLEELQADDHFDVAEFEQLAGLDRSTSVCFRARKSYSSPQGIIAQNEYSMEHLPQKGNPAPLKGQSCPSNKGIDLDIGNWSSTNEHAAHAQEEISSPVKRTRTTPKPLPNPGVKFGMLVKSQTKQKPKQAPHHILLEVWNELPNVRHHTNQNSQVYAEAVRALKALLRDGLGSKVAWDADWLRRRRIGQSMLSRPWSEQQVIRTMKMISLRLADGGDIGSKSALSSMDLPSMIYNPRTQTSFMLECRDMEEVPTRRAKLGDRAFDSLDPEYEAPFYHAMRRAIEDIRGDLLPGEDMELVKAAKAAFAWFASFESPPNQGFQESVDLLHSFLVRTYGNFQKIRANQLAPGRKMFAAYVHYLMDYYNYEFPVPSLEEK